MSEKSECVTPSGSADGTGVTNISTAPPELDTWGIKGFLTMDQHEALIEFMSRANESDLNEAKFSPESLENVSLRFLRARLFSVENALILLAECIQKKSAGRAAYFASVACGDECVKCDLEALKKFYPHEQLGFDKFNRPILYERSGLVNPTAIACMTQFSNLLDYHWFMMERKLNAMFEVAAQRTLSVSAVAAPTAASSKASSSTPTSTAENTSNRGTSSPMPLAVPAATEPLALTSSLISTCVILDLEGVGLVHCSGVCLDLMKSLITTDNSCYPETLGKMFVINSPWVAGKIHTYIFINHALNFRFNCILLSQDLL